MDPPEVFARGLKAATCVISLAAEPPPVDIAFWERRLRVGVGLRAGIVVVIAVIIVTFTFTQFVAHNSDSVIETSATFFMRDHAGAKAAPAARTYSDVDWLLSNCLFHLVHRLKLGKALDIAYNVVLIISAFAILSWRIGVRCISHEAIFHSVSVEVCHPAAITTPAFPIYFIIASTSAGRQCAVDSLHLREAHGRFIIPDGESGL